MPYHLSKKNQKLVEPQMRELEKRQTVFFASPKPLKLLYIIRQALNVTHQYLKPYYTLRLVKGTNPGVRCIYEPLELDVLVEREVKIIPEDYNLLNLVSHLLNNPLTSPTRFPNVTLSPSEIESLKLFCSSKNILISSTSPLELENDRNS